MDSAAGLSEAGHRKAFTRASDLAINGAPPAFSEPLHVGRPNLGDRSALLELMGGILDRRWLTNNGPLVHELEARLSRLMGVRNCVAMCNGTVALEIAIRALGLSGEVIVPSYTFIATAHALHWQAITPVFADIDPETHNIDPESVRRLITPRTSGIIGVHLWGRPAPTGALADLAREHGLRLVYDAAHAFGCRGPSGPIGGHGECEVFSFHATKVFNTFEGGAVATNDDELAERLRLMRNFGFQGYDNVVYPGTNGKMPEVNAAMGLVNLNALDGFVEASRRTHQRYIDALEGVPGVRPVHYDPATSPNYHYMVVEVDERHGAGRDRIVDALHAENILARKYFWPGCHAMQPYRTLYPRAAESLPNTRAVAGRVVVLPAGPTVGAAEIEAIAGVFRLLKGH